MSCDIHQYAEFRKDGKWIAEQKASFVLTPPGQKDPDGFEDDYEKVDMNYSGNRNRNYGLFGLLCEGVRYDTPHAFAAKGEPDDMSKEVEKIVASWGGDGHSHNHLTFQELKEKAAGMLMMSDSDAQDYCGMLPKWINSFGPNPEGVNDEDRRVVFFFDN